MKVWKIAPVIFAVAGFVLCLSYIVSSFSKTSFAATTCTCIRYEYFSCPGNDGCKPCPGSPGCPTGAINRCTTGVCIRCAEQKCATTDTASGAQQTIPPPSPIPPTATPKPVVACVDSDGGSVPNGYGEVKTSAPAPGQVLKDTCLTNVVTQNTDGSSTSRWVSGETGTHVGEKTCTNTATGAYADTVHFCQNGCVSGACRSTAPSPTPVISCASRTDCPTGYRCFQPPMPTCPQGQMCTQMMPARYCIPDSCPLHSKGDANCDGVVDGADYTIWIRKFQNLTTITDGHSADFNDDRAVTTIDFEIWRATRYN